MSRTQLRLGQITGSFGDFEGGIVDNLPVAATLAAIPAGSGSMVSAMSQLASAVQRIHGGTAFSTQAAGVFAGRIQVDDTTNATSTTDGSLQTDGGLSVALDAVIGDDLFLKSDSAVLNLGADSDVTLTHDGSTGGTLAASAGKVDITAGAASTFSTTAGNLTVDSNAGNLVLDGHTGVDIDASNSGKVSIDGAGGIDIGVAADVAIDIDSSTLDIDASGNITIDASAGSISIGTNSSGRAINIGHTTSEVTVNDNLTVTGDLTVNGTTTTVDSTNTVLADRFLALASGSLNADTDSGIIFNRATADLGGGSDMANGIMLFDGATGNVFKFGVTNDNAEITAGSVADDDLSDVYVGKLLIDGANDYIDVSTNLQIIAAADIVLNPGGNNVLPGGDSEDDLGADGTAWRKLFVDDIDLNGQGRIDLDTDGDTSIRASADDTIMIEIGAADSIQVSVANSSQVIEAVDSGNPSIFLKPDEGGAAGILLNGDLSYAAIADDVGNDLLQVTGSAGAPTLVAGGALGMGTTQVLTISGSQVLIDNGAASGELALRASDGNELRFDAPTGISTSVTYTFPAAPSNGLFLQTDTNGDLSWASAAGGTKKGIKIIAAQVNANTDVSFSSVDVGTAPTDFSTAGSQGDTLDVFVNGQLLLSGSNAQITSTPPTRDFEVTSTTQLRFAFTLEVDDVVTVINR